mgnify:CR=1 FL=1
MGSEVAARGNHGTLERPESSEIAANRSPPSTGFGSFNLCPGHHTVSDFYLPLWLTNSAGEPGSIPIFGRSVALQLRSADFRDYYFQDDYVSFKYISFLDLSGILVYHLSLYFGMTSYSGCNNYIRI